MVRISMGDRIGIDNAFLLYSSCEQEKEKKENKIRSRTRKAIINFTDNPDIIYLIEQPNFLIYDISYFII